MLCITSPNYYLRLKRLFSLSPRFPGLKITEAFNDLEPGKHLKLHRDIALVTRVGASEKASKMIFTTAFPTKRNKRNKIEWYRDRL